MAVCPWTMDRQMDHWKERHLKFAASNSQQIWYLELNCYVIIHLAWLYMTSEERRRIENHLLVFVLKFSTHCSLGRISKVPTFLPARHLTDFYCNLQKLHIICKIQNINFYILYCSKLFVISQMRSQILTWAQLRWIIVV